MVDVSGPERARYRFAHEVGDRAPLLLSQRPETLVNLVVEIELCSDHAMYVHRDCPSGQYALR